MFLNFPDQTMR